MYKDIDDMSTGFDSYDDMIRAMFEGENEGLNIPEPEPPLYVQLEEKINGERRNLETMKINNFIVELIADDAENKCRIIAYDGKVPAILEIPHILSADEKEYVVSDIALGVFQFNPYITELYCDASWDTPYAFFGCPNLKKVVLGENVDYIGHSAFANCESLSEVILPHALKVIPYNAFKICHALESITLPEGLKAIDYGAFSQDTNLKTVVFPTGLEYIGEWSFDQCYALEAAKLKDGLRVIDSFAFNACINLKVVELPDSLEEIGDQAFMTNHSLEPFKLPKNLKFIGECAFCDTPLSNWAENFVNDKNYTLFKDYTPDQEVPFPLSAKYMWQIDGELKMKAITLSNTTCRIASVDDFKDETLVIPSIVSHNGQEYIVTEIGSNYREIAEHGSILYSKELKHVILPASGKKILDKSFWHCKNIESIEIGPEMEYIGHEAFDIGEQVVDLPPRNDRCFRDRAFIESIIPLLDKFESPLKEVEIPKDCYVAPDAFSPGTKIVRVNP